MESKNMRHEYDFSSKNPNDVLTDDELEHFEEGMKLKNMYRPANEMDFGRSAVAVAAELDYILP